MPLVKRYGPNVNIADALKCNTTVAVGPTWVPSDWGSDALVGWSASNVNTSGSDVTQFNTQIVGAKDIPSIAGKEGTLIASHAALNNQPAVQFAGAEAYSIPFPGDQLAYSGDYTFFYVIDNQEPYASNVQNLCYSDSSPSGTNQLFIEYSSGNMCYSDSGIHVFGNNTTPVGAVSHAVTIDQTGAVANCYESGVLHAGPIALATARNFGFTFTLGANKYGTGNNLDDCYLAEFWILKRVATAGDLSNWFAWTLSHYGK